MKHPWLLYLFGIDLILDLVATQYGMTELRYTTKPLLMILLGLFVWRQHFTNKKIKTLLLLAIGLSLSGDIFLLFDKSDSPNFIFGLISFLLAHIFYILLFVQVKRSYFPQRRWNPWIIVALLLYVVVLIYILNPYLGDLKIPVIVYALVLSGMLITAWHAFDFNKRSGGGWIITGAVCFVLSDSLLAFNKFYAPIEFAGIAIMLTYGIAQLLITAGITKFIHSADKP
jgi:uncharacterized membrane protein YhhN